MFAIDCAAMTIGSYSIRKHNFDEREGEIGERERIQTILIADVLPRDALSAEKDARAGIPLEDGHFGVFWLVRSSSSRKSELGRVGPGGAAVFEPQRSTGKSRFTI